MSDGEVLHGDAFDLLDTLPEGHGHAAVVDFPWEYGNGKETGRAGLRHGMEWDMGDNDAFETAIELLADAVVDGGWVFAFADDPVLPEFRSAVEETLTYRKTLIWDTKYFGNGHYFRSRHQYVIAATNGETDRYAQSTPTVIQHAAESRKNGGETRYPTEKPSDLYRDLLAEVVEPGERVLEPFCGTAPAYAAASQLGADYWGCDVSEDAIKFAKERGGQSRAEAFL